MHYAHMPKQGTCLNKASCLNRASCLNKASTTDHLHTHGLKLGQTGVHPGDLLRARRSCTGRGERHAAIMLRQGAMVIGQSVIVVTHHRRHRRRRSRTSCQHSQTWRERAQGISRAENNSTISTSLKSEGSYHAEECYCLRPTPAQAN